jgi:hypothetical protein
MVNPVPETAAEEMVTGAVPVEVSVKDCIVGVLTSVLPKARLAAPIVNCGEV